MKERKTWDEFREAGLLWFINMILHLFGWAIVVVKDEGKVIDVYPARVYWRGFSQEANDEGYLKVTRYLKDNVDDLLEEITEDDDEHDK